MYYSQRRDPAYLAELRKRANENLSQSAVSKRRQAAADKAAAIEADKQRRKLERDSRKAHKNFLRAELKELKSFLRNLPAAEKDIRSDSFYKSDAGRLQGALEELDSQREHALGRIARLESDLRRA